MKVILAALLAVAGLASAGAQDLSWKPGDAPAPLSGWAFRKGASPEEALASADGFSPYDGGALPLEEGDRGASIAFRAAFSLDTMAVSEDLALYLGPGEYPRDVYLNGMRLLKTGDHGGRYASTIFYSSRMTLPPELLRYGGEPNVVVLMAYPDFEKTPWGGIMLGAHDDVSRLVFMRDFFNVHFIQASLVMACFIGLYFFLLFLRSPDKDRRYLLFALACVGFILGHVNISFYNDAADEVALLKTSRVGLALMSLFFTLFLSRFTGVLAKRRWFPFAVAAPVAASIVVNLLQPDKHGTVAFFSGVTTTFVLTPILLLTLGILVVGLVKKRDASTVALTLGFSCTIVASVMDLGAVGSDTIPFCYMTAYGYMACILSIFFVLAFEQSGMARTLYAKSAALNERNDALVDMVRELKDVAAGLIGSSSGLESTIDATLRSVEAFGDETRRASEAFDTQAGALEREIDSIARRLAVSAERVPKAIESQTAAVEQMNGTLSDMKARIEENLGSAEESSRIAERLSASAADGSRVIARSRDAMNLVSELSGALQGVLSSIEDIAERTHVLSINAAIESARLGSQGKGFAVVAQEIRNLSEQSRTSLASSFGKIAEIADSVAESASLSESAAATLLAIAEQARTSAARTEDIRRLIELQRAQGDDMVKGADALLADARLIKELSADEKRSNEESGARFGAMKESLATVAGAFANQESRKAELSATLVSMRVVMAENASHIERLSRAIARAGAV